MTEFLFAARHLAVIGLLVLAGYVLGRRLLSRIAFRSSGEKAAFCASLGLGLIGTALFLLGLARLLHVGVVAALGLAALAACGPVWRELAASVRAGWRSAARGARGRTAGRVAAGLLVFAGIAALAIMSLYPPLTWDAISYHLAAAKIYAQEQAVRPADNLRYCVAPQLNELLFALMLMVSDDLSAQLVQFAAMVLVAVLLAGWCGARYPPLAGPLAAGLWLGSPLVLSLGSIAYIDIGVAFFCTMAVFALVNGLDEPEMPWMRLAGASAGFAAGTKYTGLVAVAILGLFLVARALRGRSWRAVAEFSACSALVAAPWYAFTFAYTGNPFSPYLASVIPDHGCWDARDSVNVAKDMARHGGPRTLAGLLALPAALSNPALHFGGPNALSKPAAFALPLFLVGALRDRRTRVLGGFALAWFVFWFFSVQITRYMLGAFPAMCALAVVAFDWAVAPLLRRVPRGVASACALAGAAALVSPAWGVIAEVRGGGPPPMTDHDRDVYLERIPSYRCAKWLNDHYGRRYRVLTYTHEYMTYYFDGERLGDGLGRIRYSDIPFQDARALHAWLTAADARFLMFTFPSSFHVESQPFFQQRFELVCGSAHTRLYRLAGEPVEIDLGPELVVNGGFDHRGGWQWVGSPGYTPAHGKGDPAGRVGSSGYPYQEIAVLPDQLHRFSFRLRCATDLPANMWLHWYDRDGALVGREHASFECRSPEKRVDIPITAPRAATLLQLKPIPATSKHDVGFDDVSVRPVLERIQPGTAPRRAEIPARPLARGLEVEPLADGLAADVREASSMLEMAIPRTVVAPGQRAQVELALKTDTAGPFAVRFVRVDGTLSRRAFFEPPAGSRERRDWVRVLSPRDYSGDTVRLRIHPPPDAASGSFELANLSVAVVDREAP